MTKMIVTEDEIVALAQGVKPTDPPLRFSFGAGNTYLDTEDPEAAHSVAAVEAMRAAEADRLEATVTDAIAEELAGHLLGRAAGDEAPDDSFPSAAATAVFRALKVAGYRITRKD